MSGDYSRKTFDPKKNFSGVLNQQGRVALDSDWNEYVKIVDRRWRIETIDIIGRAVVPRETVDGFRIELSGGNLLIHPRWMYVDGLLAENYGTEPNTFDAVLQEERGTGPIPYDNQPYFPEADTIAPLPEGGPHIAYLDVWQREVTHLQEPGLIEPALGVDTTTRVQTVWQVKVLALDVNELDCHDEPPEWNALIAPSAGRLSTATNPEAVEPDPCLLPPGGGYRGLENRLYRVEIHEGGGLDTARFKWARHNGSIETAVTAIDGAQITVVQSEWDAVRRFEVGNWVEITDDVREFAGRAGEMRQIIEEVDYVANRITLSSGLPSGDFPTSGAGNLTNPERHTRIRRWDQQPEGLTDGLLMVTGSTINIEPGIQITFSIDPNRPDGEFKVGDYWIFYARTANPSVEILDQAPPCGIHHHYAKLAVVTFPDTAIDCRVLWPPQIGSDSCCTVTVGDGIRSHGDYQSIQEAIARLPGGGGKVCILPGDYRENIRIVGRANVTLAGCGIGSRISSLPPSEESSAAVPVIYIANSANVHIESLAIEAHTTGVGIFVEETSAERGESVSQPVEGLLFSELDLQAARRSAVEVHAGRNLAIRGCRITMQDVRGDSPGIFLVAHDTLIEQNEITVVRRRGTATGAPMAAFGRGGLQLGGTCERVRVINNFIHGGVGNGITLGSLEQVEEDENGRVIDAFIAWPVRRGELSELSPVSPRIPPWLSLGGNNGNDEPPRYRSAGPLYGIEIDNNRLYAMGLNGIGVAGFFDLDAVDEFISVQGLSIRNNHIRDCLSRPLAPIDPAMIDSMGYGGIALGDVENLVIHHNQIIDNGLRRREPVSGIFVLHGEGITITDNQIINNGAMSSGNVEEIEPGRRGGIHIVLAVVPTMLMPVTPEGILGVGAVASETIAANRLSSLPRQNGVPAAKIHDNVVSQPLGCALLLTALGPVSVANNQFTSRSAMPRIRQLDPLSIATTVLVVNLGASNDLSRQANNFSEMFSGSLATFFSTPLIDADAMVLSRKSPDNLRVGRYLVNGNVLFSGNQCVLDLWEARSADISTSIAILSLDDVGFHGNQCDCNLLNTFVYTQALLVALSLRVSDNRFKESINNAAFSARTAGMVNATTNNQATHCLLVSSELSNARVAAGNRVLLESMGEISCQHIQDMLGSTNFRL